VHSLGCLPVSEYSHDFSVGLHVQLNISIHSASRVLIFLRQLYMLCIITRAAILSI